MGFGCASLGSRVSEAQGRRCLESAFERGVTWYDVAPSYGDGEAETILGKFLTGRRDRVAVCTKFGIPRPTISPAARLLRPAARAVVRAIPLLRSAIGRARETGRKERFAADQIEPSVVESLRRLRTDYVDVLALHDPQPGDCTNESVLRALERLVQKGYARTIAIAGTPEAIAAGARATTMFRIGQFRDNPMCLAIEQVERKLERPGTLSFVTHGAFDHAVYDQISRLLVANGGRLASLASQLAYGPPSMASDILMDHALARNSLGIVLVSMMDPAHVELNCSRASRRPRMDVVDFVQKMLGSSTNQATVHHA